MCKFSCGHEEKNSAKLNNWIKTSLDVVFNKQTNKTILKKINTLVNNQLS